MLANRLLIIGVDASTLNFPPRLNSGSHNVNCLIKKRTVLHEFYMIHWDVSIFLPMVVYPRYGVAHSLVFSVSFIWRLRHF